LVTSKNLDLVAKNGRLQLQLHASSEAGKEAVENRNDDPAHELNATGHPPRKARISVPDGIYGRDSITNTFGFNFRQGQELLLPRLELAPHDGPYSDQAGNGSDDTRDSAGNRDHEDGAEPLRVGRLRRLSPSCMRHRLARWLTMS
jgi:hypothetical protein